MINFRTAVITDKDDVDKILAEYQGRNCEFSFQNLFAWAGRYETVIAIKDGSLLTQFNGDRYLYPVGGNTRAAVELLMDDARERGIRFIMTSLTADDAAELNANFPDIFTLKPERDAFDYIYDINKLSTLEGRHLHQKRNHIRRFEENQADWNFELINNENIKECMEMGELWHKQNQNSDGDDTFEQENTALKLCLDNYEALKLDGGLIRSESQVVAFTMGGRIGRSDTYNVNFEKARSDIQGAYTIINREFCKYIRDKYTDIKYINREDDLGIPGLRKAKLSYRPEILLEKYTATL
jgi:hypothetical protein